LNTLIFHRFNKVGIADHITACGLIKALKDAEENYGNNEPQQEILGYIVQGEFLSNTLKTALTTCENPQS
jgi:hypothetical protein